MEPQRQTASHLLGVQQELIDREPIFHRPELGTTRADFEAMTAAGFWETGASGQRYSLEYAIDNLVQRWSSPHKDDWKADGFHCQEIAPNNYLLTYTLRQGPRMTRRMTLWRRSSQGWQIVYHQGALVEQT